MKDIIIYDKLGTQILLKGQVFCDNIKDQIINGAIISIKLPGLITKMSGTSNMINIDENKKDEVNKVNKEIFQTLDVKLPKKQKRGRPKNKDKK